MKLHLLSLVILFSITGSLFAQSKQQFNTDKKGLAIQGYDPVSYISEQKSREGKPEFSYNYKGVVYHFSSEANKKSFIGNPEKYEPAYGGWCAYAMGARNEKVKIDPETFKIINGKTYLFYNFYFNNTLSDWNKNEAVLKSKADSNWKKLTDTK